MAKDRQTYDGRCLWASSKWTACLLFNNIVNQKELHRKVLQKLTISQGISLRKFNFYIFFGGYRLSKKVLPENCQKKTVEIFISSLHLGLEKNFFCQKIEITVRSLFRV